MLYNQQFLNDLDKVKHKTIYARITALTFEEAPVSSIEGRVTAGSINLDGASAVRRTCNLTIVAQNFDYSDYAWGMNTKFKLEIGVANTINPSYPNIIWFNQGIYIINSFSTSRSTSAFNISISGKDKMCLLNGEVSGTIGVQTDFGTIEEEDAEGIWTIRPLPIQDIIRNAVHSYGGEPYHNIIIKDLNTYGLELLEYRYENVDLILCKQKDTSIYSNAYLSNNISEKIYRTKGMTDTPITFAEIKDEEFEPLVETLGNTAARPTVFYTKDTLNGGSIAWTFTKITYGDSAGYRVTDLTYPGDLIGGVGESLTSILDKIKNMLVEFEYFYDVDGRFIFQKKQSYTNTMWSPNSDSDEEELPESIIKGSTVTYTFQDGELITAFNNNPNLMNLRNDFSIWGERKGISGAALPIHLRYAVDVKPIAYTTITTKGDVNAIQEIRDYNTKYGTTMDENPHSITYSTTSNVPNDTGEEFIQVADWREVLYQMAKDYFKHNILSDFDLKVKEANPHFYPTGKTGYEQYYTDIQVCWRQLYNPELKEKIEVLEYEVEELKEKVATQKTQIEAKENEIFDLSNSVNYLSTKAGVTQEEVDEEHLKLLQASMRLTELRNNISIDEYSLDTKQTKLNNYLSEKEHFYYAEDFGIEVEEEVYNNRLYWCKDVYENPAVLNYWFDFLDSEGELSKFNVKTIGPRTKAVNETTVKSIYFRETPNVIFGMPDGPALSGYKYISVNNDTMDNMFTISAQGKSAKERLDELLYNHGYCSESVTITTIPIYHLQPNTRVHITDHETKINGDYIVSKLTIPLTYNGTMSITATKAAQSLFMREGGV